jgi:hypothetical protein
MAPIPINTELDMPAVESSALNWIDYDKSTQELYVTFKSGKTYTYYGVPEQVYLALLKASSKGIFFNEYIRDQYSVA